MPVHIEDDRTRCGRSSSTVRSDATPSTGRRRPNSPTRSAPSTPTTTRASPCCGVRAGRSAPAPTCTRCPTRSTPTCPPTGRWGRPGWRCRKPVIAAISGHAVAGGLELALWCDLRVVESDAVLGVFCRRWGVPLIDGGTVRLPRIVGLGRALDLILTGRPVGADEALAIGLANRVVPAGHVARGGRGAGRRDRRLPAGLHALGPPLGLRRARPGRARRRSRRSSARASGRCAPRRRGRGPVRVRRRPARHRLTGRARSVVEFGLGGRIAIDH